ncbi:MAG: hypothetical protein ACXW2T_03925 [Allosphingosinicella sp.]
MLHSRPGAPADKAKDSMDADVLPALSVLLGAVTEAAKAEPASFDARSAELRDMNRQIIELTRFLAAVAANASAQSAEANIRA